MTVERYNRRAVPSAPARLAWVTGFDAPPASRPGPCYAGLAPHLPASNRCILMRAWFVLIPLFNTVQSATTLSRGWVYRSAVPQAGRVSGQRNLDLGIRDHRGHKRADDLQIRNIYVPALVILATVGNFAKRARQRATGACDGAPEAYRTADRDSHGYSRKGE